jgi:hypothetical protein
MTVRKGEPWGRVGPAPHGLVLAEDDREVSRIAGDAVDAGREPPPIGLVGGDLMRAVGGTGDRSRFDGEVAMLPIDLLRVDVGGRVGWACSHVVVRGRAWAGEIVMVMNAQHRGRWDVAPRAHPGDGRADVVRVDRAMSWRDRARARQRLPHGLHVPHPAISIRQAVTFAETFERRRHVVVDGVPWGRFDSVRVDVVPAAAVVVV